MPELSIAPAPPRSELLRQLRGRLGRAAPGLRLVAEGVLGGGTRIDFVGVAADGGATLVLVGAAGEDLELVARGLAQRAWLEPRLPDWLQLAPDLGIRPELGVRVVLLCPSFGEESRAAARTLGAAAPELAVYTCIRNGSGVEPLVEPLRRAEPPPGPPSRPEDAPAGPQEPVAAFRTGLTDADLGMTPEEAREFE